MIAGVPIERRMDRGIPLPYNFREINLIFIRSMNSGQTRPQLHSDQKLDRYFTILSSAPRTREFGRIFSPATPAPGLDSIGTVQFTM
jgi:hypothetical protein